MSRSIVLLTEGYTNPRTAKTAASVLRYCGDEVVALIDRTEVGGCVEGLLGVKGVRKPIVGYLGDVVGEVDTLMIGIAPPGGKLPESMRAVVIEAVGRGMNVVSGLHDFLSDDAEIIGLARERGVVIDDVRKNDEKDVTERVGIRVPHEPEINKVNKCVIYRTVWRASYWYIRF